MIAPDVRIVDLHPAEWARVSQWFFTPAAREIQVLRRDGRVLSMLAPDGVDVPTCDVAADGLVEWCDSVRERTGVDRVTVFDADEVARLARSLAAMAPSIPTQGDLLLVASAAVADSPGIVSAPPYTPSRFTRLVELFRRVDGWTLVVCGDDDHVEWTVLAEIRDHRIVTLSTADHATDARPPAIALDALVTAVGDAVALSRVLVGPPGLFRSILDAEDDDEVGARAADAWPELGR